MSSSHRTTGAGFLVTWFTFPLSMLLSACSGLVHGPTPEAGESASVKAIIASERDLTRGVEGAFELLERLYSPEFTLITANGEVRTKEQRLSMLRAGQVRNLSRATEDVHVRVYGDAAIVTGVNRLDVVIGGARREDSQRFVHVWVRRGDLWQLVVHQATRVPNK